MAVGLDLDQYQMKKRVLLVFAPEPDDARYDEQHSWIDESRDELDDWNVIVFGIFEDGPSFAGDRPISHEESDRARDEFGIREGEFGIRLIDLDGTSILRSSEPLPVPDISEVIAEKGD